MVVGGFVGLCDFVCVGCVDYIYICLSLSLYIYIYVHIYVFIYIYIYIYIYMAPWLHGRMRRP